MLYNFEIFQKHGSMVAASRITPKQKSYCFNCQCTVDGLFARNICRPCEAIEPAELVRNQ